MKCRLSVASVEEYVVYAFHHVWITYKKICVCKEAVPVFWKQQYADGALCYTVKRLLQLVLVHPHQFGVLWYGSFTQIERLLYILYLFLWELQLETQSATKSMTFTCLLVNLSLEIKQHACMYVCEYAHGPQHTCNRRRYACSNTQTHTRFTEH